MKLTHYRQLCQILENSSTVPFVMPSDLLLLPHVLHEGLNQAFREGQITLPAFSDCLRLNLIQTRKVAEILAQKGFLQKTGTKLEPLYLARFGGRTRREGGSLLDKI
jgi:hypothetical protein